MNDDILRLDLTSSSSSPPWRDWEPYWLLLNQPGNRVVTGTPISFMESPL